MALNAQRIERYSRQIVLPEVGAAGQQRLSAATVVLTGASGLAAHAGRYLAGAGVGRLRLVEPRRAGLAEELAALNPEIAVSAEPAVTAAHVIVAADLDAAACDVLGRQARASAVPLIGVGLDGTGGWLHVACGPRGCLGCAARHAMGDHPTAVLGAPAAGVLGALAALCALRLLLDLAPPAAGSWWRFDAVTTTLERQPRPRAADCGSCRATS